MADVSAQLNDHAKARKEYFIAAQDCRLLFLNKDYRAWSLQTRLWLLSKVLEQLKLSPDEAFQTQFMDWEGKFIVGVEEHGSDATLFRAVIDCKHHPDRPADLEFGRITEDIIAGN